MKSGIEKLQSDLVVQLPEAMKEHYLKFKCGMPVLDWFPMEDDWEPIWVHEFLLIGTQDANMPNIQSIYA